MGARGPMTDYAPSGVAQTPSGKAQPYLPHDTPRVPRCLLAKFHHDRIKTMGARGPKTDYAPSGVAQTKSGKAQPYLPHDTPRVPRCVHAKFHNDRIKTIGARGPITDYAPSGVAQIRATKRNFTYPMSPAGSQGVSMPSFMSIGLKL